MKKNKNFLEFIPLRNEKIGWKLDDEKVTLIFHRYSLFERIMHKIFKKAEFVKVELEEIGSKIWLLCDGKNTIYDISQQLEKQFGNKIEPTIPRLINYINTLKNNSYIYFKK